MADFNPSFLTHPGTGDLTLLKGKRETFQSFKTLVLSSVDDFIMRSDINGAGINDAMFENDNAILRTQISGKIREIAKYDEPRITIKDIIYSSTPNHLNIHISYLYDNEVEVTRDIIKVVRSS